VQPTPLRAPRNPVARPAVVVPSVSTKLSVVIVKPGDSLWKFAAERLGNGRRWHELLSVNPGLRNPNHIEAGSEIVLPASVSSVRTATKYAVRHGDTLSGIAQTQLRHASSWSCIAQANPAIRDANLIHEGQVLLIPASCLP
jgi:nucleoid-associated protein YgaU